MLPMGNDFVEGDARHADRVQPPEQRGLPRPLARLRPLPRRGGDAAGGGGGRGQRARPPGEPGGRGQRARRAHPQQRPRQSARLRLLRGGRGSAAQDRGAQRARFRARCADSSVGTHHNRQNTGELSDRDGYSREKWLLEKIQIGDDYFVLFFY